MPLDDSLWFLIRWCHVEFTLNVRDRIRFVSAVLKTEYQKKERQ